MPLYDFSRNDWERNAYARTHVDLRYNIKYTKNPHILVWWTENHDKLVKDLFMQYSWRWTEHFFDELIAVSSSQLRVWKASDPLCRTYSWGGILECFAAARAIDLGLTCSTEPRKKKCSICDNDYWEDEIPPELLDNIGFERIDFCITCLDKAIFNTNDNASVAEIEEFLISIYLFLERIPSSTDLYRSRKEILKVKPEVALETVRTLCRNHPSVSAIKYHFGSWLNALIQTKLLCDDTRPTSRGTQCIAKDGHLCLSLAEKQIDDWLFSRNVMHEREFIYGEGKYRADFKVGEILIEYFGLAGDADYDKKTNRKQEYCNHNNIILISIFPEDILVHSKLEKKLEFALEFSERS